jgi:hypothetical protein
MSGVQKTRDNRTFEEISGRAGADRGAAHSRAVHRRALGGSFKADWATMAQTLAVP